MSSSENLEFKYEFLGRILRPLTNRGIEMDADSIYLALTESTINKCMTAKACKIYTNWVQKTVVSDIDFQMMGLISYHVFVVKNIRNLIIESLVSLKLNGAEQKWFV